MFVGRRVQHKADHDWWWLSSSGCGIDDRDKLGVRTPELDAAIQQLVMGPQRVRMREILYDAGWERP